MESAAVSNSIIEAVAAPVNDATTEPSEPAGGIALCLSGGGYRAMLFHLGALWRLNEIGYLRKLDRVSSVSGGSIINAVLGLAWKDLDFNETGIATRFDELVARPILALANRTLDVWAAIGGVFTADTAAEWTAYMYDKHLFHGKTLQDLPDEEPDKAPRFIFNASNMRSGALWRFSKPYARDYRVGYITRPKTSIAHAVAASSAFPPFLSPLNFSLENVGFVAEPGSDLPKDSTRAVLTDGGVYDNLGLETAWKSCRTILVSDGGGRMQSKQKIPRDWLLHTKRVLDLIDNQVRALRKRQLIGGYRLPRDSGSAWRSGTYWGIFSDIANYQLKDSLPCPYEKTRLIAAEPTRLANIASERQQKIVNWGYAVSDTAMRRWVLNSPVQSPKFPFPKTGVG